MLKNNEERGKFISDPKNWDVLEYDVVSSQCSTEESDKELHGGLITGIPEIRIRRLKGTSVYKIEVKHAPMYYNEEPHFICLGTFEFHKNGNLKSVYDMSYNQLITYLRENKI